MGHNFSTNWPLVARSFQVEERWFLKRKKVSEYSALSRTPTGQIYRKRIDDHDCNLFPLKYKYIPAKNLYLIMGYATCVKSVKSKSCKL